MKGKFVTPRTFWLGATGVRMKDMEAYLAYTDQKDFLDLWNKAKAEGLSDGECLCSFYAKLCYASLVEGKNSNVTKTRTIPKNLENVFSQGHGSVLGHAMLNFVTTDCSRVLTHELVRNHVGTEYSQTSGRYCRLDKVNLVLDPCLEGCTDVLAASVTHDEETVYELECRLNLRVPPYGMNTGQIPWHACALTMAPSRMRIKREIYDGLPADVRMLDGHSAEFAEALRWVPIGEGVMPFDQKKKLTSAIRYIAPNGQSNEIGWSINMRALRHVVQMRTSRHSSWEIRLLFNQVYELVSAEYPKIFCDARVTEVDGLLEIAGMRTQPYADGPNEILQQASLEALQAEIARRTS